METIKCTLKPVTNDLHYYEVGYTTNRDKYYLDYCCTHVTKKEWVQLEGDDGYYVDLLKTNKTRIIENNDLAYIKWSMSSRPERMVFCAWQANADTDEMWKQYTGVEY